MVFEYVISSHKDCRFLIVYTARKSSHTEHHSDSVKGRFRRGANCKVGVSPVSECHAVGVCLVMVQDIVKVNKHVGLDF